jgi:uncharacterized protein YndB with AHSA1/START domain
VNEINHRIGIACSVQEVFEALTTNEGLSMWWTSTTTGADGLGSIIEFRFNNVVVNFEVVELKESALVRWRHSGNMPEAWMGTEVSFELTPADDQVYLLFSHSKWKQKSEFMAHCSMKWAVFLLSLKDALEKGEGRPFPSDVHIDHDE